MEVNIGGRPRNGPEVDRASSLLRQRRLELGLTKQAVGERIGITKANYAYLEKSFSKHLQDRFLEKLSFAVLAPQSWLRDGTGLPPPAPIGSAVIEDDEVVGGFIPGGKVEVAQRIKDRRMELGISKPQVANVLQIAVGSYSNLEETVSARAQRLHIDSLVKVLHADRDWILYGVGEKPAPPIVTFPGPASYSENEVQSMELRMALAKRAMKRRKDQKLKVSDCMAYIQTTETHFRQAETCLRLVPDYLFEQKWEEIINVPRGWLRDPRTNELELPLSELNGYYVKRAHQSIDERVALAKRAKERRIGLGLKVIEFSETVGLNVPTFRQNETMLRKFPDVEVEARWEIELEVPVGWLRDESIPTPEVVVPDQIMEPAPSMGADSTVTWSSVSDEIRSTAAWLSRKAILRRTTQWGSLTDSEKSWAEIFSIRYGVLGDSESTLGSIGQRVGLTRERVRQIVNKMVERSDGIKIPTPMLNQLSVEIDKRSPALVSDLDRDLKHVLGESLTIQAAQRFASEVFGKKIANFASSPWNKTAGGIDRVIKSDSVDTTEQLIRCARSLSMKMIRTTGAASIHFVCGAVSEELETPVSLNDIRVAIGLVSGFEWLSEVDGWYWFGNDGGDNRLQNVVKKVMSAARRKIDIDDIHTAMGRSHRGYYGEEDGKPYCIEAPITILAKVLQRTPWLMRIQMNDFLAIDETVLEGVLSDIEREIVTFIRLNDGVVVKYELDAHIAKTLCVTQIAVNMALGRSPCLVQPALGMYSICGCDIEPYALARAAEFSASLQNKGTNSIADEDGFYTFEFELSEYHTKHKIIGLPGALSRKLNAGECELDGQATPAKITKRESGLTLLSKMMPRIEALNATVGDALVLKINPEKMVAMIDRGSKAPREFMNSDEVAAQESGLIEAVYTH